MLLFGKVSLYSFFQELFCLCDISLDSNSKKTVFRHHITVITTLALLQFSRLLNISFPDCQNILQINHLWKARSHLQQKNDL